MQSFAYYQLYIIILVLDKLYYRFVTYSKLLQTLSLKCHEITSNPFRYRKNCLISENIFEIKIFIWMQYFKSSHILLSPFTMPIVTLLLTLFHFNSNMDK